MKIQIKHLVLVIIAASALVPAMAQTTVPQNPQIAAPLLEKANAGDAVSQVLVGESYAAGKGVTQDCKQAAEWYRKAADKHDVRAQLHLAALYRDGGKRFPRDMAQAAAWYRKAAEQGNPTAQATLGLLYSMGQGLPRNDVEAYYWLDLAAAVKGPNQEKFAANRQIVGTRVTADELTEIQDRVAQWQAAHPRLKSSD